MLHKEILTQEQVALFPLLKKFGKEFGLVGGTAIALHIGHRRSIDFDFFSYRNFRNIHLKKKIQSVTKIGKILVDKKGEFTFIANNVKITFFNYPFEIDYLVSLDTIITIPDIATLAAMKAYALGRRANWKDYVDLYFIIKGYHSIHDIIKKGEDIFGKEFNSKIFRTQLSYFDDINYDEKVEFLPGQEISEKKMREELIEFSLQ